MTPAASQASAAASPENKKEENEDVWGYLEAQASFLGPSLWDNGDLKVCVHFSATRDPHSYQRIGYCVCFFTERALLYTFELSTIFFKFHFFLNRGLCASQ